MSALITRQIDPGTHDVNMVDGTHTTWVGRVWAEGTASQYVTEHWVLNENWRAPTENVRLEVRRVDSEGQHASLAAFIGAMEEASGSWSNVTYIKADCTYTNQLPMI